MQVDLGGVLEEIVTREEFTINDALDTVGDKTIAVIGRGPQGGGQADNLRQNGFKVIHGLREGPSYHSAIKANYELGKTLFSISEAVHKGDIVLNLLSDAAQADTWKEEVAPFLYEGNMIDFAHGFPVHFSNRTGIIPANNLDVGMVAPKGTGGKVRENFLDGSGINSSYAVHHDHTGNCRDLVLSIGIGIGSGFLFETTMANEVISDHFGERAFLLGQVWAIAEAFYEKNRAQFNSPEQAFIYTSEQLTQVIMPMIGRNGVDEIYTKAAEANELGTVLMYQQAVRNGSGDILKRLYSSVTSGVEAQRALDENSKPDYRQVLKQRMAEVDGHEMWIAGKSVRDTSGDRLYGEQINNWALAGAVIGAMEAQYAFLISKGHSPAEASNETIEEATQSLNPHFQDLGITHLIGNCSTTAQVGALDWGPRFKKEMLKAIMPLENRYEGSVIQLVQNPLTQPNMWDVMRTLRTLRPEYRKPG